MRGKTRIRRMRAADLDAVAEIWLKTNLETHGFVSPEYWKGSFAAVRGMLLEAELYVYEDEGGIQGFAGLDGGYIAGIFVRREAQSGGIGKQLMDHVKSTRGQLTLSVYQKNRRAVEFYHREGFVIQGENTDRNTGEKEYQMLWKR